MGLSDRDYDRDEFPRRKRTRRGRAKPEELLDRSSKQLLLVGLILAFILALAYLVHYHMQIRAVNNMLERLGLIQVETAERLVTPAVDALHERQDRLLIQREREEAARQREAKQARRERAFERAFVAQYEVPEGCESWDSQAQMVECTNHRIRARQEFRADFFGKSAPNQLLLEGEAR